MLKCAKFILGCGAVVLCLPSPHTFAQKPGIDISAEQVRIETAELSATIRKKGYVSGVAGGTFLDKKTGFRDAGFGLDIVDWIMEPGSDEAYRDQLPAEMIYQFGNAYHGKTPKRSIEGPQICTQAKKVNPQFRVGPEYIAVRTAFQYLTAAPGKETGSKWSQLIVFPFGKRYFISSDRIDARNNSDAMFLRIDMPGHIKHTSGDTFSEVYLSYIDQVNSTGDAKYPDGIIPSSAFLENFAPDERFNYRRDGQKSIPKRFIRAYHLRDPKTGKDGPWLAGMTLDPSVVYEAWCHQRGYVCMIEEFGGRPIKAGESFSAAFIVGFFDSIEDMHRTYDEHAGHTGLVEDEDGWRLTK